MTVLSRAFLRKLIIQEMNKPKLSSGLEFDDDDEIAGHWNQHRT